MGPEDVRILPAQGVFVPRISHDSRGNRIIPLLLAGAAYDSGAFQVRGYNKLEIFNRADQKAQIYVYMGPNPASLLTRVPGDEGEKAMFEYAEFASPNGIFDVEQYSVQIAADFARIIYLNDSLGAQTFWEYQLKMKPIAEPDCIRVYDEELPEPMTRVYKCLTLTPDHRLRVDGEFSPAAVQRVKGSIPEIRIMANNSVMAPAAQFQDDLLVDGSIPDYAINPITLSMSIAPSGEGGAGNGEMEIFYRTLNNPPGSFRTFDKIHLAVGQHKEKVLKITRGHYRFIFTANTVITGLDAMLMGIPVT